MDNKNIAGLDDMISRLESVKEYINNDVLDVTGVEGVNHFKRNFQEEGFDGKKWAPRKTVRKGSTNGQKILSGSTGELADATDYEKQGNEVVFSNDKPYAQIHNEGFNGPENVRAHVRTVKGKQQTVRQHEREMNMPQRQFIGDSEVLNRNISNKIVRDIDKLTV